ncbi:ribosome-associated translation inhibitor RaiA [Candidatus Saganbacteria bacterium]|nr:ribosome-associated translation inhibitor RaiA [Candidatus Saganbacteria bacterium]
MQINIQAHHTELTAPIRSYATKKIEKLQEYYKNILKAEITLEVRANDDTRRNQVTEVTLWVSGKKVIRASDGAKNIYAAIDLVEEELKKQLKKHKDKHIKEARRSAEKIKSKFRKPGKIGLAESLL